MGRPYSEAMRRAQARYNKTNTKQVVLKLNLKNDADILEHLEGKDNKQGYLKALIRADIARGGGAPAE